MTTPRDDIAGLSESLRIAELERDTAITDGNDRIEDLHKEIAALSARVKELAADHALLTDPIAVHINMCRGAISKPSWENIRHLYPRIYDLEAAESRSLRLQQERDEAIKLIRPLTILAEDTARVSSKHGSEFAAEMSSLAARARSFVRRLASGPEKEG